MGAMPYLRSDPGFLPRMSLRHKRPQFQFLFGRRDQLLLEGLHRFFPSWQKPLKTFMLRSSEVETVKVHDFVPHRYKVMHELLLGVLTSVDFRQGPELGVRPEGEGDTGA